MIATEFAFSTVLHFTCDKKGADFISLGGSDFPSLSEYGLIGDGRTAALVSRHGSIEWLCFPRFDSDPFFAGILDRNRGGYFRIAPSAYSASQQFYLDDSNVLVTEFTTSTGKVTVTDFFSVAAEEVKRSRLWPEHEILRVIEVNGGTVEMMADFSPCFAFDERLVHLEIRKDGVVCAGVGERVMFLQNSSGEQWRKEPGRCFCGFRAKPNERLYFSLTYSDAAPAVIPALADAASRFDLTHAYWKNWLACCRYRGPFAKEVRRSALALKLMLYAPSGAIVAAPTASLPERIGGERNWDYRYCWLRDAAFTVRALSELGFRDEARAFSSWMLHATRLTRPRLQVMYTVFGRPKIKERVVKRLGGYRGSRPVRVGNAAHEQHQLDVYGEVLDALCLALHNVAAIDRETRQFIIGLGEVVLEEWRKRDDGIWEVRSGRQQHTHSKVLAWVALDRLIKMCRHHRWPIPFEKFESARNEIQRTIETHGFNSEIGAYVRTLAGRELDASLLVLPLVGYCSARSPHMLSTIGAIERSLCREGLVYRYRDIDDGVGGREGAFGICSLWFIECLAKCGRLDDARILFGRFIERGNGVALWPEEIEPESNEFLGNYPQAFTHVGLINCALTLYQGGTQ